ncbi:MAG: hypothetical protein IJS39_09160 [Synergistaceae bacterium]|nr:hypothetical protein [Synergistaceae bacterium]
MRVRQPDPEYDTSSTAGKIAGAITGATAGAVIAGPMGAIAGAVIGSGAVAVKDIATYTNKED